MTDHHLYIAGTGRAGTSFLVRYLTAVGMDTTLARVGTAVWHEEADAGLEESPPSVFGGPNVPYVVKTPWLSQVIDQLIETARDRIDGVIVPIRDLSDATRSRLRLQRRAMHAAAPWLDDLQSEFDAWGSVPGGVIYSLGEADQARLLAVGFHHLIERCVAADVPLYLLHFPRIVNDHSYLFSKLRTILPRGTTAEASEDAFSQTADRSKVHEFRDHGTPG